MFSVDFFKFETCDSYSYYRIDNQILMFIMGKLNI